VRYKKPLFLLMLSTMMIPAMVTMMPFYVIVLKLGFLNHKWFWLLLGLQGSPFIIFLFRQFLSTIPVSFEESAMIEGASRPRILVQIILPMVQTSLIIALILLFQWSWADYLTPALFLSGDKVNLAVKLVTAYQDVREDLLANIGMAGILVYALPIVILFFALQRRFIAGLLSGGLKG
jgi:multiple sugar transport system permease protein